MIHMKKRRPFPLAALCVLLAFSLCACSGETAVSTSDDVSLSTSEPPVSEISIGTISDIPLFPSSASEPASSVASDTSATQVSSVPSVASTPASSISVPAGSPLLPIAPPDTDTHGLSDSQIFSFYQDAVFVGDSISLGWRNYVSKIRKSDSLFFGGSDGTQFLVSGSLGAGNALWGISDESVHPSYQGTQMQLWNSIPLTGAKKVFVMFGLNDVALYGVDQTLANFATLFGKIKANVPDVQFYVLSATYVKAGGERGKLTSSLLRELNLALINFCNQNGYAFINIADALADSDGNLKAEYCSDGFVHQTNAAYEVWTSLLKGYAAAQLSASAQ